MNDDLSNIELLPVLAFLLGNANRILKNQALILEKILDIDKDELADEFKEDILSDTKKYLASLCKHFGIDCSDELDDLSGLLGDLPLN